MRQIKLTLVSMALFVVAGCATAPYSRYDVVDVTGSPYVIDQATGIIYEISKKDDGSLNVSRAVAEIGRE